MGKFYEDLRVGFEDIVVHRRGKITLRTERIEIPEPGMDYKTKDTKKIRKKGLSRRA